MKRIVILCLSLVLLLACVPTPEEEVVVGKADDALEETIHGAAMDAYSVGSEQTATDEAKTLRDALAVPQSTALSISGPVYGGTLHVEMNAETHVPDVSKVPVLLVGRLRPSASEKQRIAESLTGATAFFASDPLGNERFLIRAEQMKQTLSALDAQPYGPEADYDSLREDLTTHIQIELNGYRETPPGSREPWNGSWSDERILIYSETGKTAMICTDSDDTCYIHYDAGDAAPDGNEQVIDATQARQLAEDGLNVIGCKHYVIEKIRPEDQKTREAFRSSTGIDDGSFKISIRPCYEGIPVYAWNTYFGSDTASQQAGLSYSHPPLKERIFACIQNGKLSLLEWDDPIEILAVENENVSLLSFDRIMEIFKQQIFMNIYLDSGERTIAVTDIYFSYRCMKKRDSDQFYLLPAWDFIGYDTLFEKKGATPYKESLLSVNAIDGSILNDLLGY